MFSEFFIKRPVFSIVAALIVLLVGGISIPNLPVAQYPDISPKQVTVTSIYTGADARTVEDGVTTILERAINGVQGMRYMTSSSTNDGTSSITVTFASERDQDIAAVDVQNRVSLAEPQLPEAVIRTGVAVNKESSNILMAFGLFAENGEYDNVFLSNYADLYLLDALKRVPGVGNVIIFGERKYAMRLWLDPNRLASRNLTAQDVVDALQEQNIQVGAGRIGQPPIGEDQEYQVDLRAVSRFTDPSQFEDMVVATRPDDVLVKFRDVGRVELGAENYNAFLRYRGNQAVGLGIFQVPGSNAIEVARAVKVAMADLAEEFPSGMTYAIGFDTTDFVEQSLEEVTRSLLEAIALVVVVIFVFLQDWRTTFVPAIVAPLSLIGTFAFIKIFGFSINNLTLFGLTLGTGLVVDDAIVVVEDIVHKVQDLGMKPQRAAIVAMRELFGAVIATSLVLVAVFVPVAFFPGTTGALYRQFALTIAFSVIVSTFLAVTLTPMMSASLIQQQRHSGGILGRLFGGVNWFLDKLQLGYRSSLNFLVRVRVVVIACFVALIVLTGWVYARVPSAFLPDEDQGYMITIIQGPEGSSLNYTSEVMSKVESLYLSKEKFPEVRATFAVGGFGFSGSPANSGVIFTTFTPWSERESPEASAQAIIGRAQGELLQIPEARIFAVNPPAIQGLGSFGGFQFQLQDRRGNLELGDFVGKLWELVGAANQDGQTFRGVFSTYSASTPQMLIEVDRNRAKSLDINVDDVFDTLQTYLGSTYVNDFVLGRRTYRVYVQADQQFRNNPEAINQLYVRSGRGIMVPLGNLVRVTPTTGAQTINHYNTFRSIEVNGAAAPGTSSGQAIERMEQLAASLLPPGMGYEWSGASLEEIESKGKAPIIFSLGLIFSFLVLAAQYESFIDPAIIMLAVPLAILGALVSQSLRGFSNDVYCQVGLVMLIGLASKNSILIVEFANQKREEGLGLVESALGAAQQRLRPILMTALSTLMGTVPLMVASGAGAASRQSLGTAVFGGMCVATFLSLLIVPVLYVVVKSLSGWAFQDRRRSPLTLPEYLEEEEPKVEVSVE